MKKWMTISAVVLLFAACNKKRDCPGPGDKNFAVTKFSKVSAGENFTVTLSRGSNYAVYATGCTNDLADLDLSVDNGQTLKIGYQNFKNNRDQVNFNITLPSLTAVNFSGNTKGNINGFKDQMSVIRSVLSGNAFCELNGAPVVSQVELSGNADLKVIGVTENLYGNITGNAVLHAYPVTALEVDIDVSGNANAYVLPLSKIFVTASGNSCVYYKGDPAGKQLETSGNAKIIHE